MCLFAFVSVLDGGEFDHCKVKIPGTGGAADFEADCSVATAPVYTSNADLNQLTLEWQVEWNLPRDTPNVPSHVTESEPGIIGSHVDLILKNAGKALLKSC